MTDEQNLKGTTMQTIIQLAQSTDETIDAIVIELVRIALDNVLRSLGL